MSLLWKRANKLKAIAKLVLKAVYIFMYCYIVTEMFVQLEHEEVVKRGQYLLVFLNTNDRLAAFLLKSATVFLGDWLDPFRQVL